MDRTDLFHGHIGGIDAIGPGAARRRRRWSRTKPCPKPRRERYAGWSGDLGTRIKSGAESLETLEAQGHVGRVEPGAGVRSPGVARGSGEPGHLDLRGLTECRMSQRRVPTRTSPIDFEIGPYSVGCRHRPSAPGWWVSAAARARAVRPTRRRRRDRPPGLRRLPVPRRSPPVGGPRGSRHHLCLRRPSLCRDHRATGRLVDQGARRRRRVHQGISVESRRGKTPRRSSPRQYRTPTDVGCRRGAITQFRLGGVALIPPAGRQPLDTSSRRTAASSCGPTPTWPILVSPGWSGLRSSRPSPAPGSRSAPGPTPGRLGYLIDGQLFTKEITPAGAGTYPDRGAVGQVFVDDSFCELESVGTGRLAGTGVIGVSPGGLGSHRVRRPRRLPRPWSDEATPVSYVIGIDSSTTATKAIVIDRRGRRSPGSASSLVRLRNATSPLDRAGSRGSGGTRP